MYPYLTIFGKTIPVYWLCGLLGLGVCVLLLLKRHKSFPGIMQVDITNAGGVGLVGMILGARVLYLLTMVPVLIHNWAYLTEHPDVLRQILYTGMVFYGGLLGFITAIELYLRHYRIDRSMFWDYAAPCLPLFHAFGRIGCFFTGCCYGFESDTWGLVFADSAGGPNDVPFFPLQLVGAGGELVLCLVVLLYEKHHRGQGKALPFYLAVYACCRFVCEFLRGDAIRGLWLGLSTSQWVSLLLLCWLLAHKLIAGRKTKNTAVSP